MGKRFSSKLNEWMFYGDDIAFFAQSFASLDKVKAEIALVHLDLYRICTAVPPATPFEWWSLKLVQALDRQRYILEVALRKREAELAKIPAIAYVGYSREQSDSGRMVDCVFATCLRDEDSHTEGPVWGTHERSVARVLAQLTRSCPCRAKRHEVPGSKSRS